VEKTPNDKFRDARERTKSPDHPDECLSRQEVADQANAWIWEHHGKKYDLNKNYVGKIEQGVIRWPDAVRRAAFRAILKVSKDSELGFVNARARSRRAVVKLDDVKRRHLIETTALGVSGLVLRGEPVAVLLGGGEPPPVPRRVGASDIAQIRDATQEFNSWDRTYGGGVARATVRAQVRWSAGLLEAICSERLRPELFSAVGDLAHTAAFMAVDAGAYQEARRLCHFALSCAEEVKDWPLRANVLDDMARQEILIGRPDEGLTLVDLALVRADDWLTATERTMLHGTRALALAKMRRVQETLRAIGTADKHFARSSPADDPLFMAFYNDAWHNQITGRPLFDLVIVGRDPTGATTRLTAAATGHPERNTRERAICLTRLASLTMVTGDPLQAASIGHEAVDIAGPLRSRRAAEDLRELSRYATTHQHLEEVEHLRQRIATLLCTDNPQEESSLNPSSTFP
jgi:hypothetical protein